MPKQNIPFPSVTVCPAGIGIFKTDMRKAVANQLEIPEKKVVPNGSTWNANNQMKDISNFPEIHRKQNTD